MAQSTAAILVAMGKINTKKKQNAKKSKAKGK